VWVCANRCPRFCTNRSVRDGWVFQLFLRIDHETGEHSEATGEGFDCYRSEISGQRCGIVAKRFGLLKNFSRKQMVDDY